MRRFVQAVVLIGVVAAFVPAVIRLVDLGRTNEYAGHAMFVPLFSALIAWTQRDRLRAAAGRGTPLGLAVLAAGVAILVVGYALQSAILHGVALAVATAGAVQWLYGTACLRAAAFPVGFLIMTAPIPTPVVAALTLHLQVFAANFAAAAVRTIGIPVYQSGVIIELPVLTLQVAEVCNGLRFLVALLVMTAAFAHVTITGRMRRVTLIAAAVPVAVLANAVRVAAIAVGVHYIGPDAASGTVHNWIGKGVWGLTLIPLIGFGWWLGRADRVQARRPVSALAPGKTRVA